jgi:hypothetical protein
MVFYENPPLEGTLNSTEQKTKRLQSFVKLMSKNPHLKSPHSKENPPPPPTGCEKQVVRKGPPNYQYMLCPGEMCILLP